MIPQVLLPKGFLAAGINSGVRRYRPDLALVLSTKPAHAAGVFTRSTLKAAPVRYCQELLPSGDIRAIIINSGHANAATGQGGVEDNLALADKAAEVLDLKRNQVLVSSTGVIGERMPLDILLPAVPMAARCLGELINNFALAIMTTDLVPKFLSRTVELSSGSVTITGAAKGSGMIHPNMGTMLGYIFTDADLDKEYLTELLPKVTDESFNMISVDGETSTNDSVILMANGASGVKAVSAQDQEALEAALRDVAVQLAISIARDGEGASKLITVKVKNYPDLLKAREVARMITISPLVKSAIHGEDPNWGRILARLGQSGVPVELLEKMELRLQGLAVFSAGQPTSFKRKEARALLHAESVTIDIDFKSGDFEASAWGCDLTRRYVEINTEYS